jgi:hypothetical protein
LHNESSLLASAARSVHDEAAQVIDHIEVAVAGGDDIPLLLRRTAGGRLNGSSEEFMGKFRLR